MELISFILFVISMITASALVSGSEAALLSVSLAKVKELNSTKKTSSTKRLLGIKLNLQKYITSIVILNNIINIIGSIYVGILATQFFGETYIGVFSGVLTFLIILFSEIIPKIYGEKFASQISQIIAIPLYYITLLLTPLVMIMEKLTSIFVRGGKTNQISEGDVQTDRPTALTSYVNGNREIGEK